MWNSEVEKDKMVPTALKKRGGTMILTRIPKFISDHLRAVKDNFKFGYYRVFCWLLIAQSIYPGKQNLAELSRWTPPWILYKSMVRLLQSDQWDFLAVFRWEWQQIYTILPAPSDGVFFLTVDKTTVEKTGKKGPVSGKTKDSEQGEWKYGFQVVVLMANWGNYRFPIDFRIVRKKSDPEYKKPNALFCEMLEHFCPPLWARKVIVLGDSGFASKKNMQAIISRRNYYFVFSLARTWKFDKADPRCAHYPYVKDFVNQVGLYRCKKMWFKGYDNRRRSYWIYSERVELNAVGRVTMVISKKRHNTKPEKAKILVSNIPGIEARDLVYLYTRRWFIECLFHELKSACGLGQQQVTKTPERVQRAVAMTMMAYLFLLRFEWARIPKDKHWSISSLKYFFTCRLLQAQCDERKVLRSKKKAA